MLGNGVERNDGPTTLVFSRHAVPPVRREPTDDNLCRRGAYVLAEATGGARKVTLLATGSEVALAIEARELLQGDSIPTAVVSMPCWEAFDAQDETYRTAVLGLGTVRVAVEAATRLGWERYIGLEGGFVGMSSFGASGTDPGSIRAFRHHPATCRGRGASSPAFGRWNAPGGRAVRMRLERGGRVTNCFPRSGDDRSTDPAPALCRRCIFATEFVRQGGDHILREWLY